HQSLVDDVGADLARTALDPLLDLRHMLVDDPRSPRRPGHPTAGVASRDVTAHRLRVDPGQLRRRVRTAGGVIRLKNLHDLPVTLLHASLRWNCSRWSKTSSKPRRDAHDGTNTGPAPWPQTGRSAVRQQGSPCP